MSPTGFLVFGAFAIGTGLERLIPGGPTPAYAWLIAGGVSFLIPFATMIFARK